MLDLPILVLRLPLYLSLMLLFGWPLFRDYWQLMPETRSTAERWGLPLLTSTALVLAILEAMFRLANLLGMPLTAVDGDSVRWFLADLPAGRAASARVLALSLLLMLSLHPVALPMLHRRLWLIASAVALSSLAWNGHAAAGSGWRLTAGITHLLAAGTWGGAIAVLLVLVIRSHASGELRRAYVLLNAMRSFAMPGTAIVGLLVLSGAFTYLDLAGNISGLWTTAHGRWLSLKLGLVSGMLLLAALHRWSWVPALEAGLHRGEPWRHVQHLRSSLAGDAVLAVLVLACVALLGMLDPAV